MNTNVKSLVHHAFLVWVHKDVEQKDVMDIVWDNGSIEFNATVCNVCIQPLYNIQPWHPPSTSTLSLQMPQQPDYVDVVMFDVLNETDCASNEIVNAMEVIFDDADEKKL